MYNLRKRQPARPERPKPKSQRGAAFDPNGFDNRCERLCDSSDSDSDEDEIDLEASSEDESDEDYFKLKADPLVKLVAHRLKHMFPDLPEEDLMEAINNSIQKANDTLIQEYCGAVPNDETWKIGLDPEEVEQLDTELKQLRSQVEQNRPTIPKILKSNLSNLEKTRALQMYDALQNMEPYTMSYVKLSQELSAIIQSGSDVESDSDLQTLLQKNQPPTLTDIVSAYLPESDKLRAVQLYETMQIYSNNTEPWITAYQQLKSLLNNTYSSLEEVSRVEIEEQTLRSNTRNFEVNLKKQIFDLDADPMIKGRLYKLHSDMMSQSSTDSRYGELRNKLMWYLKLPYGRKIISQAYPSDTGQYCSYVFQYLNQHLYGMTRAKEQILQILNDRVNNSTTPKILGLAGKPGVGKTKLAKTIADAIGLPFGKINLGGAIDSTIFKGSEGVWSGSAPSLLLQLMCQMGCSNGLILLDEVDKLGLGPKGLEVQSSLLHILDPSQNQACQDLFLSDFPHDLSNIWFICTMNDPSLLDPALRDRMHILDLESYSRPEMIHIIKDYTLPTIIREKGFSPDSLRITEDAANEIVCRIGCGIEESGMRPVEHALEDIVSKISLLHSMRTSSAIIPLSYSLPRFNGFPYTIKPSTVRRLYSPSKISDAPPEGMFG